MGRLTTTASRDLDADLTTIGAEGELDLETAPVLRAALLRCMSECPNAVIVDLGRCRVAAPTALAVLGRPAGQTQIVGSFATLLLCAARGQDLGEGATSALGGTPVFGSRAQAQTAAVASASRQRIKLRLARSADAPRRAREAVGEACDAWGLAHLRSVATLVISELVTNAIVHATGDPLVEAAVRGGLLRLRVHDASVRPPVMAPTEPPPRPSVGDHPRVSDSKISDHSKISDRGRGLPIVDHLSTAWGYLRNSARAGKVVWATLSVESVQPSRLVGREGAVEQARSPQNVCHARVRPRDPDILAFGPGGLA